MRASLDRIFLIFALALAAFVVFVSVGYPPGSRIPLFALALVPLIVASARAAGLIGAVVTSAVAALTVSVSVWAPVGGWWSNDTVLVSAVVLATGVSCGAYVARLGRDVDLQRVAQENVSATALLGVGLVPRSIDAESLGAFLGAVESMTSGRITVYVGSADGITISPLPDARCPDADPDCDEPDPERDIEGEAVALLVHETWTGGDSKTDVPVPIIMDQHVFAPLVSSSGLEGVLVARRFGPEDGWNDQDGEVLRFCADLLAALLERDRLQIQGAHLEAMEEADRLKASILMSISHDLRTPLAAASATVSALIDRSEDSSTEDDLRAVSGDLAALDWRIGELIDLSRLESAEWKPRIDWNDLSDLSNLVIDSVRHSDATRLRVTVPRDPSPFRFDLVQMGRALHHLVENALAYSPAGEVVTIEVQQADEALRISVIDRGPGVADSEKTRIFEKFYRGQAGGLVPHGTGLGLAIAACIVESHGGVIEVEDAQPVGAVFTVVLPRRPEEGSDEG